MAKGGAFRVKQTPGDVGEAIAAESWRIDGGALVLWSGSIFEPRLVRAYGPGGWHSVTPEPVEAPHG